MDKSEPKYIHAILYFIIIVLSLILIKIAIIDPKNIVETQNFNKKESRLRMKNLKQAQILWEQKHGTFTSNIDSLVSFVKNDPMVDSVINSFDSLSRRPANPFVSLSNGEFTPDSLLYAPQSHQKYILQVDTSVSIDTVTNRRGKIVKIDSTVKTGTLYYIEDPDGYGTVGSTSDAALKNTSSWE